MAGVGAALGLQGITSNHARHFPFYEFVTAHAAL